MLLKVLHDENEVTTKNMHVSAFPEMSLFTTSFVYGGHQDEKPSHIDVTHCRPSDGSTAKLSVPITPDTEHLETISIDMHSSTTTGFIMPTEFSGWFSDRIGYRVLLVYLGGNQRTVIGNFAPNAHLVNAAKQQRHAARRVHEEKQSGSSWLSGISNYVRGTATSSPREDNPDNDTTSYKITFADCVPYLVASTTSLNAVSARLPTDQTMDITKFRPNIVVSGADEAFEEDFWAELALKLQGFQDARLTLTSNCVRCQSINVDYATGEMAKVEGSSVYKKLQVDRRVDGGNKFAPVFGRYGFLDGGSQLGMRLTVGDGVEVTKRNNEHTAQKWPGFAGWPKEERWAV
ncbi:hypothetical protein MRB53_041078 [Persea americana]|nr:hypothetical protein MRB53_041078 [Persea americana]